MGRLGCVRLKSGGSEAHVVGPLGDDEEFDGAIDEVHGEALAPVDEPLALRARVRQLDAERRSERGGRVAHQRYEAAGIVHALVLGPRRHHRAIIQYMMTSSTPATRSASALSR